MLYVTFVLSALLLGVIHFLVRKREYPLGEVFGVAFAALVCPAILQHLLPAVMFQAVAAVVLMAVCGLIRWNPRVYIRLYYVVTASSLVYITWHSWQTVRERLQEYPSVSMEDRIPVPKPASRLTENSERALESLEYTIQPPYNRLFPGLRTQYLAILHEDTVQAFVEAAGFGYERMQHIRPGLEPYQLTGVLKDLKALPQPAAPSEATRTVGANSGKPASRDQYYSEMAKHSEAVADFVFPEGFGYLKDRRHVAGFLPHQFRKAPELDPPWKLQTLDLIGLVRHSQPVAYVSANLPRMDELRKAPTRPLDEFEAAGVKALEGGEEMYIARAGGVRRMVGAIRSAKQCVDCHGGQRGDLLGAFSYTFKRNDP